ncbi:hypothetical protein PoB_006435000 [Plakobranchus ocellatus]|uniref:Uncharacterized protein n=1 Tax=Plakobranchus ocellatus TaxID=259542 RepID=A0AAV4D1E9_9GAST|nr:hypothetical protein PoB_006435000 [Plakobranchus ocellatus]
MYVCMAVSRPKGLISGCPICGHLTASVRWLQYSQTEDCGVSADCMRAAPDWYRLGHWEVLPVTSHSAPVVTSYGP